MFPAYFCDVGCVKTAHLSFTRMEIFLFHHQNENWDDLNLVLQNKVVVPERQDPMLVLKFIWMEKNIGIALDQLVPGYGSIPLSPYYFWPRKDAWEELRAKLEEKEWISQKQMIILLNQATDIINLWQQGGGSLSTWVPPHPVLSTLQACVLLVSLHALSVVNVKVMVRGLVDRFNQFSVMDFFLHGNDLVIYLIYYVHQWLFCWENQETDPFRYGYKSIFLFANNKGKTNCLIR